MAIEFAAFVLDFIADVELKDRALVVERDFCQRHPRYELGPRRREWLKVLARPGDDY